MSRSADDPPPAMTDLSVDSLSQAFAQLIGEGEPSERTKAHDELVADEADAAAGKLDAEVEDEAVTPESILEAVLFVGHPENQPLTSRLIASYLRGVTPQEVDEMIVGLNAQYSEQGAPYVIVSDGPGYRMTLREEFRRLRETFLGKVREARLTQAAIDLLAIVAYRQPISRDEIDKLRGEASGAILSQLVRRQLLQLEHTTDKPRRKVFRTTDRFLALFGLESLEDLPQHDEL